MLFRCSSCAVYCGGLYETGSRESFSYCKRDPIPIPSRGGNDLRELNCREMATCIVAVSTRLARVDPFPTAIVIQLLFQVEGGLIYESSILD